MLKKEKDGITWYEFEKLQPFCTLHHALFTRNGGVSSGAFSSLNFSTYVGDEASSVAENLARAKRSITLNVPVAMSKQVHGVDICSLTAPLKSDLYNSGFDAFTTNQHAIALGIQHADCQAAIFFDPKKNAIACAHAGWRGSCQNIYKETILRMKERYGSMPEDLIVCISPSLGPEKAEFIHYEQELPKEFWPFKDKNNYFNFWEISQWQLQEQGILPKNIEVAGLCTYSDSAHFFSHRRDKVTGRHLTVVWLENS